MKKVMIILVILALTLSACGKKSKVGGDGILDFTPSASASPTPTKSSPKPRVTKSSSKPATVKPSRKTFTHTITISNVNDQYVPREKVVYVGDTLIFVNKDPNTQAGHSFTQGASQTTKNPLFDSGLIKPGGKPWKWIVDVAPGDYQFHCSNIPYIQGGPLKVLPAPK